METSDAASAPAAAAGSGLASGSKGKVTRSCFLLTMLQRIAAHSFAEGSRAGFLGGRPMREYRLETLPCEHYRNRGIFGKRIAYGGDAARLGEVASPEKHCLSDPKAEAQRRGGQQEPGMAIHRKGLDPAGEIARTHRDRHPDDKPDSLRKILHESGHRAGVERDIRILGEDEIMASGGERRREIIEFWADRRRARRAQKTARNLGMEGRDAPRRVERREDSRSAAPIKIS